MSEFTEQLRRAVNTACGKLFSAVERLEKEKFELEAENTKLKEKEILLGLANGKIEIIEAKLDRHKELVRPLSTTIGLLNSMVNCGDEHTKQSLIVLEKGRAALRDLEGGEKSA